MTDFNIRSDSVDVEQIMTQIRARVQEKRGVDYTEEQIRELAAVRLEKFLDPKNLRSDLLDQFRRSRPAIPADPPPVEAPYAFGDETLFETHRGGLRFIRKLLNPILKLFFNPNKLNQVLHTQAQFNVDLLKREQRRRIEFDRSRSEWNALYYEVLHNLVLETTRNGIELKNLKMRVEALASRLDFSERRVRALEGVVQYRPEAVRPRQASGRDGQTRQEHGDHRDRDRGRERRPEGEASYSDAEANATATVDAVPGTLPAGPGSPPATPGDGSGRRRRRRRRGRRGAGMPPGVTPAFDGQPAEVEGEIEGGGEEDFEGGDELEAREDAPGFEGPQETDAEPDRRASALDDTPDQPTGSDEGPERGNDPDSEPQ